MAQQVMGKHPSSGPDRWVTPTTRQSATDRVKIYEDDYWPRLIDSLTEDFPTVSQLLNSQFETVAKAFLAAHPPKHYSLYYLGQRFPTFLKSAIIPVKTKVVEASRFDWARSKAFFKARLPIGNLPESQLGVTRFRLQSHVSLLSLRYNFHEWTPDVTPLRANSFPLPTVIFRNSENQIESRIMSKSGYRILQKFSTPRSLVNAIQLCEKWLVGSDIGTVQDLFRTAIQDAWIIPADQPNA
jgi:hypothetical protein